jgi:hypothetical protein
MSADLNGLFKQFDPPPGGADRFRARLDAAARENESPGWFPAATVAAILVVIVGALVVPSDWRESSAPGENRVATAPEFDRLLGRPLAPAEPAVTLNEQSVTLAAVQSENPKIRIYRIE